MLVAASVVAAGVVAARVVLEVVGARVVTPACQVTNLGQSLVKTVLQLHFCSFKVSDAFVPDHSDLVHQDTKEITCPISLLHRPSVPSEQWLLGYDSALCC